MACHEYLVNFEYFTRVMENYGFVPLTTEEAKNVGLPNGIGNFEDIFLQMENEVKMNDKLKYEYKRSMYMTNKEKQVSFLNSYFVYRKVRNVNSEKLEKNSLKKDEAVIEIKPSPNALPKPPEEEPQKKIIIKRKKKIQIPK